MGAVETTSLTRYETASSANTKRLASYVHSENTRENEPGLHMSETWVNRRLSLGPFDQSCGA